MLFLLLLITFALSDDEGILSGKCSCDENANYGLNCNIQFYAEESQMSYTEDIVFYILNCTNDFEWMWQTEPDFFLDQPFEHQEEDWMKLTFKYICHEILGCPAIQPYGIGNCHGRPVDCKGPVQFKKSLDV